MDTADDSDDGNDNLHNLGSSSTNLATNLELEKEVRREDDQYMRVYAPFHQQPNVMGYKNSVSRHVTNLIIFNFFFFK